MSDTSKTCPYCLTEVKDSDDIKVCPACGISHHQKCWDENNGCSAISCPEHHTAVKINSATPSTPKTQASNVTPHTKTKAKKKKARNRFITLAILVVLVVGGFLFVTHYMTQQAEDKYMVSVGDFDKMMEQNGTYLGSIGDTVQSFWKDYNANLSGTSGAFASDHTFYSIDNMRDMVKYYHEKDIPILNSNGEVIKSDMTNINILPSNSEKYTKIKDAANKLNDAYTAYYAKVMFFDGTYENFVTDRQTLKSDFDKAYTDFKALIS